MVNSASDNKIEESNVISEKIDEKSNLVES
jgi:hypothetical protein